MSAIWSAGRVRSRPGCGARPRMNATTTTLMFAAATVGSLHSLAPDHWVPFAALARARGWTHTHTARTTILCGLGHVSVSAILGIVALLVGLESVKLFGARLEEH